MVDRDNSDFFHTADSPKAIRPLKFLPDTPSGIFCLALPVCARCP